MDGLALAQEVKRRWPGVRVAVISGDPNREAALAAAGVIKVLLKPFEAKELGDLLTQVLSRPA